MTRSAFFSIQSQRLDSLLAHILGLTILVLSLAYIPSFSDPFTTAKTVTLYVFAFVVASLLCFKRTLLLPDFNWKAVFVVGALFSSALVPIFFNFQDSYFTHYLDVVVFFVFAIGGYNSFSSKSGPLIIGRYFFVSIILCLIIVGIQLVGLDLFGIRMTYHSYYALFGYPNFLAEFIGIGIIFQTVVLTGLWKSPSSKWKVVFHIILFAASLMLLISINSRSNVLGVIAGLILLSRFKNIFFKGIYLPIAILCFSLAFPFVKPWLPIQLDDSINVAHENKSHSASVRKARWLNTAAMIYKNPLGVGPGNYEYSYQQYSKVVIPDLESREDMVVKSPHNGFLELFVEYGILFGLLFCVIIFGLLIKFYRRAFSFGNSEMAVCLAILVFILIDAFFAFPMEIPLPFLFAALCFGGSFRLFEGYRIYRQKLFVTPVILLICFLSVGIFKYTYSNYYEFNATSLKEIAKACELLPENWRACLRKADFELFEQNKIEAVSTLEEVIDRNPSVFPAIKKLAFLKLGMGKIDESCAYFTSYNDLFFGESTLAHEVTIICSDK